MINETQDATNIINQMDEKAAPSMSLGGNGGNSVVDLNPTKQKEFEEGGYIEAQGVYNPFKYKQPEPKEQVIDEVAGAQPSTPTKPKEPEVTPDTSKNYEDLYKDMTQGELKTALEDIYKGIETSKDMIEQLEYFAEKAKNGKISLMDIHYINQITGSTIKTKENIESIIQELLNKEKETLSNLNDREKYILHSTKYDNRTEDQIRADKSTQLKVEDYIKAGLNPAAVSGYHGSAGGGGGSSSSNEEEERKRKKRERELARQHEKERRQDMAMKMLGMLVNTGTGLATAGIRAKGFRDSATIRNQGMIDKEWARVAASVYK